LLYINQTSKINSMRIVISALLLTIASGLLSQTIIPFDNPVPSAPTMCNDTWTESGVPQQLIPIPPASTCSFDYSSGDLWLFPARLTLDLSSISNISVIEIDLIDWCGVGCTTVELFETGTSVGTASNSTSNVAETIVYTNSAMDAIDAMTIESFENQMFEIRILTETICDDPSDAEIWVEDGDIYLENACNGIILTSPNGGCYRVTINDNGELTTVAITCP
jgi:hypothetical protein